MEFGGVNSLAFLSDYSVMVSFISLYRMFFVAHHMFRPQGHILVVTRLVTPRIVHVCRIVEAVRYHTITRVCLALHTPL
jgi:hypothetical protein